jgi:hypothetical protein
MPLFNVQTQAPHGRHWDQPEGYRHLLGQIFVHLIHVVNRITELKDCVFISCTESSTINNYL